MANEPETMRDKKILIIYHSQTGSTAEMARVVAAGARKIPSVITVLKKSQDATLDDLLECSGLAIGSPEYFGYMAGAVKDFFDRTYEGAHGKPMRLPYFVFVSAGNDGRGAISSIERIATGYRWKKMAPPFRCVGKPSEDQINTLLELGMTLAAGVDVGIY